MDIRRLGLLWVTRASGTYSGTGYAVTESLVLTAHHVIFGDEGDEEPQSIELRYAREDDWLPLEVAWTPAEGGLDACLLRLPFERPCRSGEAPSFGEYDRSRPMPYESAGFPIASKVIDAQKKAIQDTADVRGELQPYAFDKQGLYGLTTAMAARHAREVTQQGAAEKSDWSGLSGAPVFSYEPEQARHLLGVMRSVPSAFEGQQLCATPIALLLKQSEAFAGALGRPSLAQVPVAPPTQPPGPAPPPRDAAFARHVGQDELFALHQAAIEAGLSRSALLAGIHPAFLGSLSTASTPSAQLLQDLNALNGIKALADGSVPLEQWLHNAKLLAGLRPQASIFERALRMLLDL